VRGEERRRFRRFAASAACDPEPETAVVSGLPAPGARYLRGRLVRFPFSEIEALGGR